MSLINAKVKLAKEIKGFVYNDYKRHINEVGVIIDEYNVDRDFDYRVEWSDGEISGVNVKNLVFIDNIVLNQILINI